MSRNLVRITLYALGGHLLMLQLHSNAVCSSVLTGGLPVLPDLLL